MNKYTHIEYLGETLDKVVNELLKYHKEEKFISTCFKHHMLFSDTVTIDKAYELVYKKTKEQYDTDLKLKAMREAAHKKFVEEVSKDYIERGHSILEQEYWEEWDKIVPLRVSDIYAGVDLSNTLDVIELIINHADISSIESKLTNQKHSNMSNGLVRALVAKFCSDGEKTLCMIGVDT